MNFDNAFIHDSSNQSILYPIKLEGRTLEGSPVYGAVNRIPNEFQFDEAFLGYKWGYGIELFKKLCLN
jgi:hypothetical protein